MTNPAIEKPLSELSDEALAAKISASTDETQVVRTRLATDERVIARVTDGIYRQPASALRELISNAYDADATRVVVQTDAPRFAKITVQDDGHGMSPKALTYLLRHIGGSAKRIDAGAELGVTDTQDSSLSPGGRQLIGKIGIGLFSVSQLTQSFQIITKTRGDRFQTIATVALRHYSDDAPRPDNADQDRFEAGQVSVWRELAIDTESHGTTIILNRIHPQARDTLRSRDVWSAVEEAAKQADGTEPISPPKYHIGHFEAASDTVQLRDNRPDSLPWNQSDSAAGAFRKLVKCVWDEVESGDPRPSLSTIFDYYLRMVWQLGLAAPLPYVDVHPFDLNSNSWSEAFALSNLPKGSAAALSKFGDRSLRSVLELSTGSRPGADFEVFVDNLQLFRPIRLRNLPSTSNALKRPLLFAGKCRETFEGVDAALSGGPVAFEAYLLWSPKIAPKEHQGVLVRIHDASGTLFDSTFLNYQVSELTRLKQICAEIFVTEGLDSALNIDRESFNSAHPHTVFLTRWLHGALRQLATAHKRLSGEVRSDARSASVERTTSALERLAAEVWERESGSDGVEPPQIVFVGRGESGTPPPEALAFDRSRVLDEHGGRPRPKSGHAVDEFEARLKAIAQVLAAYGLLEGLTKQTRERLLADLRRVIGAVGG